MAKTKPLRVLTTEDGELWAAFAEGHIDPTDITEEAIQAAMAAAGIDWAEEGEIEDFCTAPVSHFWLTQVNPNGTGATSWDGDDTHWFCMEGAPGARPVTGVKGQ